MLKTRQRSDQDVSPTLQPPDDGGGKGDCGDEISDVAVEAGGYTAPVLEAAKHALDDVALPVDGLVIMVLDLAVLARWDDGHYICDVPLTRSGS